MKRSIHHLLRVAGHPRYCQLGLNGLDDKLASYLGFSGGVFLEAGANNGLEQSNTYYLERIKGWRGILVEPVPEFFAQCKRARPRAVCINAALVPKDYTDTTVKLQTAGLMTMVTKSSGHSGYSVEHIEQGLRNEALLQSYQIEAKAMTLDQVIEASGFDRIDFMSLDLEGYEVEALKGLNLEKYGPTWLLIEVRAQAELNALVQDHYEEVAVLSNSETFQDILYRKKHNKIR
ncbi:MAG: FkbM family methyltransferase [Verrucomicrobiota bacterium]